MNSHISTIWSENIPSTPLLEYPRPQLVRSNWTNLNGQWEYAVTDISEKVPESYDGFITVPFAIESDRSGVGISFLQNQRLHYKHTIEIKKTPGKRLMLNFEAVDWKCDVFINGMKVGSHTGGYIPFSFEITDFVNEGKNELTVSVTDPTDSHWQQRGKQKLNPTGIWYTPTSGIWQTVWLEEVPKNYIESINLTPHNNLDGLDIFIKTSKDTECTLSIFSGEHEIKRLTLESNETTSIEIANPRIWSPDDPFLYDIEITTDTDSVKSYFGIRSVSLAMGPAGRDMVLLNGSPIFLNGPLDQGYWPESGMTQPSDEAIIFDLQAMKDLGFNTIRKHIKVESRRWYYHADRLGLAVIQDMPSGGREMTGYLRDEMGIPFIESQPDNDETAYIASLRISAESKTAFEDELREMLGLLHNQPSIIIWCPFNEAWGQFDSVRIYELTKQLDPSRLVDHASGWYDQGCKDFRSVHTYKKNLKAPPIEDRRAYLISEYGGYNYIDAEHLWRNDDTFGYKYYKTTEELNKAYTDLIETQVIPLIEKGLCGVIYTQLSDVEIETNGFYTYDRKLMKFNSPEIKKVHDSIQKTFLDFNTQK